MEDEMVTAASRSPVRRAVLRADCAFEREHQMELLAQELVSKHCHFRGRANKFEFVQHGDVLAIRGCVPSFYLKQVLQSMLKELRGVRWIDNQVAVVSSCGLSSPPYESATCTAA
jgi:hypothetical protein